MKLRFGSVVQAALVLLAVSQVATVEGQVCTGVTTQCQCTAVPVCHMVVMDVSDGIDRMDLFDVYVRSLRKLACGLQLGATNNEAGKDALGLITYGYDVKVAVPLRHYSAVNWVNRLRRFRKDSFSTRRWGRSCCSPLAEALDKVKQEVFAAHEGGFVDATACRVSVTVLTDRMPEQNRFRAMHEPTNRWTQEMAFPGDYKLKLVPREAKELKSNVVFDSHLSVLLIPNSETAAAAAAKDYFQGTVTPMESRLRVPWLRRAVYKGRTKMSSPGRFPIISTPRDDYLAELSEGDDSDDVTNAHLELLCENTVSAPGVCAGTGAPTTLAPSPSPTTLAPTLGPTRPVDTCGGDKDIIFVVDASSSMTVSRFQNLVLPLVADLQRVQSPGNPKQRVGLITFSNVVKERIPLAGYTYEEFGGHLNTLSDQASDIVACCKPTAEALRAARKMIEARTVNTGNPVTVYVITEDVPAINANPYEGVISDVAEQGEVQYRRRGVDNGLTSNGEGRAVYMGEYMSTVVFKEAADLNALDGVTTYLLGVDTTEGPATSLDYYLGNENNVGSCGRGYAVTPLVCASCDKAGRCSKNGDACFVTGAVDHDCSSFYDSMVANAVAVSTDVIDDILEPARNLLCGL